MTTTLTVEEDGGISGRYNISGAGLDFTVAISADRVDITGNSMNVQVSMVGDRANIKWIAPGVYVSRNNMGQGFLPDPDDPMVYSLANVSGSMDGNQLYNSTGTPILLMVSTAALYWMVGSTIYRTGLGGHTELDGNITSVTATCFASIVDGKLFGLATSGSNVLLRLYDFGDGSSTTLYTDTAETSESWRYLTVIGEAGSETLVALSVYVVSSGKNKAIIRVFDPADGSLIRKTVVDFQQASYGTNHAGGAGFPIPQGTISTNPQIYDGKVVYSFYEDWSHYPNIPYSPPDYYHFTGVLVYDPSDGTYNVARVLNNYDLFRSISVVETGIDYEYGYYYWLEIQTEPTYTPAIKEYRIYKTPISSLSISLVRTLDKTDYFKFVTGKNALYGIDFLTENIERMPTGDIVGAIPAAFDTTYFGRKIAFQLDETDQRIWFTDDSILYGVSVLGSSEKDITLNDGTQVGAAVAMNLVKNGVAFTSSNALGLSEG